MSAYLLLMSSLCLPQAGLCLHKLISFRTITQYITTPLNQVIYTRTVQPLRSSEHSELVMGCTVYLLRATVPCA